PVCAVGLFFFNETATTEIYTLSLHDALPISHTHTHTHTHTFTFMLLCYFPRSEEHTSELQSHLNLVCRLLLAKTQTYIYIPTHTHTHQQTQQHRTVSRHS